MTNHMSTTPDHQVVAAESPDQGHQTTRMAETERAYMKRSLWFEQHAARSLQVKDVSPIVVAHFALQKRDEWAKSTWRQIKAALIYKYRVSGCEDSLQAIDILNDGQQTPCAKTTKRTSGRRAKSVSTKARDLVIAAVRGSSSEYSSVLEMWLLLGITVGLRPHEWTQAELVYARPSEIGDTEALQLGAIDAEASQPYLRIQNAKQSNGRSSGSFRHMNLSGLDAPLVQMVGEFASLMRAAKLQGRYELMYAGCRKLLLRINQKLHENDDANWVQLYSPRHIFTSKAKKEMELPQVAALLGHGASETAGKHYARKAFLGGSGSLGVRPVAAEVLRVRQRRHSLARRLENAQVGTPQA